MAWRSSEARSSSTPSAMTADTSLASRISAPSSLERPSTLWQDQQRRPLWKPGALVHCRPNLLSLGPLDEVGIQRPRYIPWRSSKQWLWPVVGLQPHGVQRRLGRGLGIQQIQVFRAGGNGPQHLPLLEIENGRPRQISHAVQPDRPEHANIAMRASCNPLCWPMAAAIRIGAQAAKTMPG